MKRLLTIAIALVLTLSLAACGGNSTQSGGNNSTSTPPASNTPSGGTETPSNTPDNSTPSPSGGTSSPDNGSATGNANGSGWKSGKFNADDVDESDFQLEKSISGDTLTITIHDKNLREDYQITADHIMGYSLSIIAHPDGHSYVNVIGLSLRTKPDNPGALPDDEKPVIDAIRENYGLGSADDYTIDYANKKIVMTLKIDESKINEVNEWQEWMLEVFYTVEKITCDVAEPVQSSGKKQIMENQ